MENTVYRRFASLLVLFSLSLPLLAQPARSLSSGEIQLGLKKLNIVGSALYMAAHPDDENTAMLAYLAKERLVRTGYLSVTRGDGGQNLIGSEQAELLGLIRTQELLQARRTDGAEQFFTRANDFGFSKSTEEALQIWGKEKVLSDAVWVIRKFQPDVLITRFPPTSAAGHGHHSASAVLAEEAFKAAADPKRFPEQLKYVKPWQVKRVVWNTYAPNFTNTPPEGGANYISVDIGAYNPLLGKSYTEIAGESRSMHKSQGFGSPRNRGSRIDYLQHTLGERAQTDLFDGINLTWSRVNGGQELKELFDQALREFRPDNPALTLPLLVTAYQKMSKLPESEWVTRKKEEVANLMIACAGLWYEVNADGYAAAPLTKIKLNIHAVKRSESVIKLEKVTLPFLKMDTTINLALEDNKAVNVPFNLTLPATMPYTQPYWLAAAHEKGMYTVNDQLLIGLPEKAPDLTAEFTFLVNDQKIALRSPITFKRVDPVDGEVYRPFEVRPEVTANIVDKVYVFSDNQPKQVEVVLKSAVANATGSVSLQLPKGWKAVPETASFALKLQFEEQKIVFSVTPPVNAAETSLKAIVKTAHGTYSQAIKTIDYKHIPTQTLFPSSEAKLVKLDIKVKGKQIGYISGAGDEVPAALRQIGYQVTSLKANDLEKNLSGYDAIVVGVRAYNTEEWLKFYQPKLMDYVAGGGNVVVQYQVNNNLVTPELGPYPFKLSRTRVTVEEAPVKFVKPDHVLLNTPNKITAKDFDGWVQERGLYFAETWDPKYETVLACEDPGEGLKEGGLLVTKFGKGTFTFTGYAFFRQLPAGVPGAYRLFANLISAGKE